MKSFMELPPNDLPLRETLPTMREETREALLAWAMAQPGAMPWLLKRSAWYWMQRGTGRDVLPPEEAFKIHRQIEAVVALDLLKWRTQAEDDRRAVEHLSDMKRHADRLATQANDGDR
jgi:hypothetical protein